MRAFTVGSGGATDAGKPARPLQSSTPLNWSVRKTRLQGGAIAYTDRTVSPAVELVNSGIAVDLGEIGSEQAAPAAASLSLTQGERSTLAWHGELDVGKSHAAGELDATVADIGPYLPYLAAALAPKTELEIGTLAAQGGVTLDWGGGFELEIANAKASVQKASLKLPDDKEAAVAFEELAAEGVAVSLAGRSATVSRLSLVGADARVERNGKGQLNLQRILASEAAADQAKPADGESGKAVSPWAVTIERIDLDRNNVAWRDLTAAKPVSVPVTQIAGHILQVGTDLSLASKIDLKARVGRSGTATARGDFVVAPWSRNWPSNCFGCHWRVSIPMSRNTSRSGSKRAH